MKTQEFYDKYPTAKRWREIINSNKGSVPSELQKEFTEWACSSEGRTVMMTYDECEDIPKLKTIRELTGGGRNYRKAHWRLLSDDEPCQVGDIIGWRTGLGSLMTEGHWAFGLSRNTWTTSKPYRIYRKK